MNYTQFERMHTGAGFIAALDQSGGSTPKALKACSRIRAACVLNSPRLRTMMNCGIMIAYQGTIIVAR